MRPLPGRLVLLGHPVTHSLSPRFQNQALEAAGIPLTYEALDVAPHELAALAGLLADAGAAGNVTVPHKAAFFAHCVRRSALAERVGAVNTFWTEDGALVGDNTDVAGFDAAIGALLGQAPSGARVALLGAGGAAAAVCAAVERWPGSSVVVHARGQDRAEELSARFAEVVSVASQRAEALDGATLVVNATPIGIDGVAMPTLPTELPVGVAVLDLTYREGGTPWVRALRARGVRADDGLRMLVEQGAAAWERWFETTPDRQVMLAALGRMG